MWALPFYTVTPLSLAHLLNMLTLTTYSPAVQHGDTLYPGPTIQDSDTHYLGPTSTGCKLWPIVNLGWLFIMAYLGPWAPSVACHTTEGEYHLLTILLPTNTIVACQTTEVTYRSFLPTG